MNFELMPLIDNRRPPGPQQIVGWAARCLRCPTPVHKTETVEAADTWMTRHRTAAHPDHTDTGETPR